LLFLVFLGGQKAWVSRRARAGRAAQAPGRLPMMAHKPRQAGALSKHAGYGEAPG